MTDALIVAGGAALLTLPANLLVRLTLVLARGGSVGERGAGRWIGILERLLIYVLVVAGEPAAAGLVVAAKSILRYPEIGRQGSGLDPEYVLVGSLASWLFAFAAAAGVAELVPV